MCKKKRRYIIDIHLYDTPIETLLKMIGWFFSWIAGIYVGIKSEGESRMVACTFFIFAFTMLMDFVKSINGKKTLLGRVIYTIMIITQVFVIVASFSSIVCGDIIPLLRKCMMMFTILPLCFLAIDTIIWFVDGNSDLTREDDREIDADKKKIEIFEQKLTSGNIGNIENQGD